MSIVAFFAFVALALLMFAWLIGQVTVALQKHNEKLLRAQVSGEGGGYADGSAAAAAASSCDGGGACH